MPVVEALKVRVVRFGSVQLHVTITVAPPLPGKLVSPVVERVQTRVFRPPSGTVTCEYSGCHYWLH